jgi:hypothetical protein
MRKLCAVLVVLAILVVGFGFYRGWFTLSSPSPADGDKVNVNLTVDRDKMKEDAETVKKKTTDLTGQATEKANEPGDREKTK